MKEQFDVAKVAAILLEANEAALKAGNDNDDDGGTCNLDSCVLDTRKWRTKDVNALKKATGRMIGEKMLSSYWKGCRWLRTERRGQANLNTRMVNAFHKYCKEAGLDNVYVYSMID